ncbi:MAG: hypothetical protein JSV52_12840 [Candidatus Zixiibacteriota bacterium]|nr:MAG: hypothetical protein JSV52_12840 [candidate division Zixibacteria bacterium]
MRLFWRFVLTTTLLIAGGGHTGEAAGFSYKAGIGYDFLSQQYFLDSASQADADSILTEWSLKTNYLDDVKGLVSFSLSPFKDRRLGLTAKYEQTSEFLRLKFLSDLRTKIGSTRLDFNTEVDWRNRHRGTASFGDNYIFGYSRAKLSVPVKPGLKSTFQVQGEFVQFDSVSTTSYNYYRIGGKVGLERLYKNFSFGNIAATFVTRQVPDSLGLNYVDFGVEGSYFGIYDQGELDVFGRLGRKDYNLIDGRNDFWRFEADVRNKVQMGERYFTKQEAEFELTDYDPNDPVNLDYFRIEITVLAGFETAFFTFGVGPEFEALHEKKDIFAVSEDYVEIGAKADLDYIKAGTLFLAVESVLGRRDLKDNNELLTDYTYERLSLIGDLKLLKRLRLNVLFSAEWEWHQIPTNDSEIYLLSSSLTFGI